MTNKELSNMLKIFFLIVLLSSNYSYSQMQQDWARRYRGPLPYGDAGAGSVCVDDSGNVYVTGAVNIASGAKCTSIKYNKYGDSLWVRDYQRPGYNYNYGNDILLDDSGNVLVAGAESVLKYDRIGNLLWTAYHSADYTKIALGLDGFIYAAGIGSGRYVVSKYDRNGNLYWRSSIIGAYKLKDLEIDKDGNILILGYSLYYITDYDYRTIKFTTNGRVIWDIHYNGIGPPPANDNPYSLTTDNDANVYVTGASQDQSSIHNCTTVKYDSSGNEIWVKRIHPPNNGYDIKVDESQNVYIAARSSGFNYTFKLDINGNIMWTSTYPTNDVFGINQSVLILDSINNVYVTANVDSNNSTRYAAIKYDNNGNQIFIVNYHYVNIEFNYVYDMVLDKNGSVYLTGQSNTSYATVKYSPTIISGINENIGTPKKYVLHQNYPNPFNPKTVINYELRVTSDAKLIVFDVLGNEVAELVNEKQNMGSYSVEFDGSGFASGIYFYRLEAGGFVETRRMILLK